MGIAVMGRSKRLKIIAPAGTGRSLRATMLMLRPPPRHELTVALPDDAEQRQLAERLHGALLWEFIRLVEPGEPSLRERVLKAIANQFVH